MADENRHSLNPADKLRQAEEHFRLLVESVKDYAIFMLDLQGRISSWNTGAQRLKGYQAEEIIGQHFSKFYPTEDVAAGKPEKELQIATTEGRIEVDAWRLRKDGSRFWASVVITSLRDEEGKLHGFCKVTRDSTEQKAAEDRLRESEERYRQISITLEEQYLRLHEANRMKDLFLANMSHELRTPLNAVIGFAELMASGRVGPLAPNHQEYLDDILNSGHHLLLLINDILDLSKVESGKMTFNPEPIDVKSIVDEVTENLRPMVIEKAIHLEISVASSLAEIVIDAVRFKQVLYNYLSNALKFTPRLGRVSLRAIPEQDDNFRLVVEDSGIGIRPEDLGRLFVSFRQLQSGPTKQYPGTGLGLALTKSIVEAQGGTVGVESVPGLGSTFWAILPRKAAQQAETVPAR